MCTCTDATVHHPEQPHSELAAPPSSPPVPNLRSTTETQRRLWRGGLLSCVNTECGEDEKQQELFLLVKEKDSYCS